MNAYINAKELMEIAPIGKTKAYQIIKDLNAELTSKGYLVIKGKVSRRYFCQRYNRKSPADVGKERDF